MQVLGAAGMGTMGTLGAQGSNPDILLFLWIDNINPGAAPALLWFFVGQDKGAERVSIGRAAS